jgi:hypothetical protein
MDLTLASHAITPCGSLSIARFGRRAAAASCPDAAVHKGGARAWHGAAAGSVAEAARTDWCRGPSSTSSRCARAGGDTRLRFARWSCHIGGVASREGRGSDDSWEKAVGWPRAGREAAWQLREGSSAGASVDAQPAGCRLLHVTCTARAYTTCSAVSTPVEACGTRRRRGVLPRLSRSWLARPAATDDWRQACGPAAAAAWICSCSCLALNK